MKRVFTCLLLLSFWNSASAQKTVAPYVLLVSFDGFRHDYLTKFDLPNFNAFIKSGARSEALIPCFPSKTFPNHYSIVTGLYPGNHGLVDNSFYDPARKEKFSMANKEQATNSYYYGGTPIWRLAQLNDIKVAPYFWVGSEAPFDSQYPDYYLPYSNTTPNSQRIEHIVNWLKMPEGERPHFITLYFSLVDDAGHDFGPESNQLKASVEEADRLLGSILSSIKKETSIAVNVIVVSDHGMKELSYRPETYIYLDQILDLGDTSVTIVNNGTHAHIYVNDKSRIDSAYDKLKKNEKDFTVYKYHDFPSRWHYQNPRSGDLLITATPGKELTLKSRGKISAAMKPDAIWGVHGYDPDVEINMHGIFCASGPNIRKGMVLPPFRNIHVYPLIAKILRLKTPVIDGSFEVLKDIYKP